MIQADSALICLDQYSFEKNIVPLLACLVTSEYVELTGRVGPIFVSFEILILPPSLLVTVGPKSTDVLLYKILCQQVPAHYYM